MEWKNYKLSEIGEIVGGATPSTKISEYYDGDIPWISPKDLSNFEGKYISCGSKNITELGFNSCSCKILPKGSVLFSSRAPIGYIAIAKNSLCTNQGFKSVIPNSSIIDSEFLYYTLVFNKEYIKNQGSGTTFMEVSGKTMGNIEVSIPVNLSDQRKIAGILSALDAKIENNNKINANLEAQAEALFKSWFVDFTPFKDQPFVNSELGPIPQGWKVGKADDFYKINIGKTPPRKEKEWFSKNESDNKWISISDMGNCGLFISNSAEKLTNAAIKKFNISLVPVNTILLSFKLTIGRVAISDCDLTTNEAIARFILPDECYLEFSFLMLKLYNYSTLGSTSSIATAVNSKIIKSMKMVMPSLKVLEDFHTITNPLFEKIRFTQKENQRLAALRDTLLPKLMSGEIKL